MAKPKMVMKATVYLVYHVDYPDQIIDVFGSRQQAQNDIFERSSDWNYDFKEKELIFDDEE